MFVFFAGHELMRKIPLTEICFDLQRNDYVSTTVDFRHYSTRPPEHRHALRKFRVQSK